MAADAAAPASASQVGALHGQRRIVSCMASGTRFDVDSRYTLIKPIGYGAYGVVCSAHDNFTGETVAIKKISKAFEHLTETKRTLREIKILHHFDHENVIAIKDMLYPESLGTFEDVYIVSELMDIDLHQLIASAHPLSDVHVQWFLYQLLRGLKYIHSAHVLHRDLKPSNLLLNRNCDLKVCDFGLARVANPAENHAGFMTEYVATRWYRAPEIILNWKEYTKSIDVWSVGCILAEMLGRKPLFPGTDYIHQLNLITDVLGTPSDADIGFVATENARRFLRGLPRKPRIPFEAIFPAASPLALDLLGQLLAFDPTRRITVEAALAHPYLAQHHEPTDEPTAARPFCFDFEATPMCKAALRQRITAEIVAFHPHAALAEADVLAALAAAAAAGEPGAAAGDDGGAGAAADEGEGASGRGADELTALLDLDDVFAAVAAEQPWAEAAAADPSGGPTSMDES